MLLVMLHAELPEQMTHTTLLIIMGCWLWLSAAGVVEGAGRICASSSCQLANASTSLERLRQRRLKCTYTRSSARSGSNLWRFLLHTKSYVDQLRLQPPALVTMDSTCIHRQR